MIIDREIIYDQAVPFLVAVWNPDFSAEKAQQQCWTFHASRQPFNNHFFEIPH